MYAAMRKLTREKLGVAVSPHRFRDAAATYFVQEMPELATLDRVVLNHASESMTRNYRTTAKQLTAYRRVDNHLEYAERELVRGVRRQRQRSPLATASRKRNHRGMRRAAD